MFNTVGFIGTGTMGSALIKAVKSYDNGKKLILSNRTPEKAQKVASLYTNTETGNNITVAEKCDLIFLGVKPQMMPEALADIKNVLADRPIDSYVLCTMAAGISCESIQKSLDIACKVIRIMPNTPVSIGKGVIQYCGLNVSDELLAEFAEMLSCAGLLHKIDEKLIDAASAVSGCGPAFAYLFCEALADGGVACGLPREAALLYAAKMLEGSAAMILETNEHPGKLKDAVCSPGGTTIQGVRSLENNHFRAAAMEAVISAYNKTLELKK